MNASPAPTGFGLLSAASWGGSDFIGGLGARRAPAFLITVSGQMVSFLVLLALCTALHASLPHGHNLTITVIGGAEGALSLVVFYRALALGAMGLTAALTGLLTALVPVIFSAVHYGLPRPVTAVGLAAGCIAIWLITHQQGASAPAKALVLGALAGLGFGLQLVLFKLASDSSFLGLMAVARAAGISALLLAMLVTRTPVQRKGFWVTGIAAGLLDTAGNLFYLGASRLGRLDTAAVICSLYPAGTILLAALFLRERPSGRQLAGMGLALAAVALLSF